jgi:hypothetical protein
MFNGFMSFFGNVACVELFTNNYHGNLYSFGILKFLLNEIGQRKTYTKFSVENLLDSDHLEHKWYMFDGYGY